MSQETASIDLSHDHLASRAEPGTPTGPRLLGFLRVLLGVIAIIGGSIFIASVLAGIAILVLYAQAGSDGVIEFYQELRFDYRLRTLVGASLIGALYIGVAGATVIAAVARGRRAWPRLVAFARMRGDPRIVLAIVAATLVYGALATLTMSMSRSTRVIVSGPTDYALVAMITTNLVLLAPIAEELFFRGWLYTSLRARLTFWPSFLATMILFAAIHWDGGHRIFIVLPLALALGLLREVTGSIRPTIALHTAYNLIIVGLTLLLET